MAQESLTLYKLIILYMLDQVDFPLTFAQISDFILNQDYTDYLTLQKAVTELSDAGLIRSETRVNRTLLSCTKDGTEALTYFGSRIGEAIRADIAHYFEENEIELRSEVSTKADYYESTSGEFEVRMTARDRNALLVDLTLSVPEESMARLMCEKWLQKKQTIYQYLMNELLLT